MTFNHKIALLPIKDIEKKQELFKKAIDENLTSTELEALLKEARRKEPRSPAGRPTLPGFLKSAKKGHNIFGKTGALEGLTREILSGLKKDEAIELREKTKHILSAVSRIEEALTKIIEGGEERAE